MYRNGTIGNMGTNIGATTPLFGYTRSSKEYLGATNRSENANEADKYKGEYLNPDRGGTYMIKVLLLI